MTLKIFLDSRIPPDLDGFNGFVFSNITITLTKNVLRVQKWIGEQLVDVDAKTIGTGPYIEGTISVDSVMKEVFFELIKSLGRKALFLIADLTADGADQDAVMAEVHDFLDRIVPAVLAGDHSVIDW